MKYLAVSMMVLLLFDVDVSVPIGVNEGGVVAEGFCLLCVAVLRL